MLHRNRRKIAPAPTREAYAAAFEKERRREYPAIDAFEREMGFALDRARMEDAARVLACPVKPNPPCWQHGRVIYAAARRWLALAHPLAGPLRFLDIGTAKGFSALCAAWAVADAGAVAEILSVDVLDPHQPVPRNSVAELDRPLTIGEFVEPWWPRGVPGRFVRSTGADVLRGGSDRVHFAFVDGKHSFEAVIEEATLLSARQQRGDIAIFDDVQMLPVRRAVGRTPELGYSLRLVKAGPERIYGYAVKE